MTKAVHGSLEKHLGNEAAFWAGIGTKVNRSKWNLGARTAVHGVEVVYETFHSLKSLMLGILVGFFDNFFWNFGFLEFLVVTQSNIVADGDAELFTGEVFVFLEVFF